MEEAIIDALFDLEDRARRMLGECNEIEEYLAIEHETPEGLKAARDFFQNSCEQLGGLIEVLGQSDSPLHLLEQMLDDGLYSFRLDSRAEPRFLDWQRKLIRRSGGTDSLAERLAEFLKNDLNSELPESVTADQVIGEVQAVREEICRIAERLNVISGVPVRGLIQDGLKGVGGVCLIVVDVTGVFTVPDFSGWVFVKAVKSVSGGTGMLRRAVRGLRKKYAQLFGGEEPFQELGSTEANQAKPRRSSKIRPPRVKKGFVPKRRSEKRKSE